MSQLTQTLSNRILAEIQDRILSGTLPPDQPLRQDVLAAALGVSKIPIREAFVRLEQDGVLVSQANRGFFVRALSVEEAEEVHALRLKLEPDAVAYAAVHAGPGERARARAALIALDEAAGGMPSEIGRLNRQFRLALSCTAANPLTGQIMRRLHGLSELYAGKYLAPAHREDRDLIAYHDMLRAWSAGRAQAVADLVRRHLEVTLSYLRGRASA